jgi:uncharacterized protein YdiU (UPF0061 family)
MNSPLDVAYWSRPAWRERLALDALGDGFALPVPPQPLPDPHWVARSDALAASMGLADWLAGDDALLTLSGHAPARGRTPLATVYSGHQFGVWAGQLGDGRAHLLGEIDTADGPLEVQLKGCGLTPFSRMGDGRAVLRSSIREFLCSEAMYALGIPTTRALAIVGSPLPVRRETVETAAVVTRVAPSFIRFGHFEHFCHHGQHDRLRTLTDAVIAQFYPECADAAVPALALLEAVARRTARLLADWQAVGFCHGVMNTDNMSILGLTIDYGPFGFLDAFDPLHICNHSDEQGRYAYGRQPSIAFWNLHALAQALLPLAGDDVDAVRAALEPYKDEFAQAVQARLRAKLGLETARDDDPALVDDFLRLLAANRLDHTRSWRALAGFSTGAEPGLPALRDQVLDLAAFDAWSARYAQRLRAEASVDAERRLRMNRVNPKYVLRNHLAETAIRRAQAGDFGEVQRLLKVLTHPFDEQPEAEDCAAPPPDWAQHLEVSCSS